MFRSSRRVSFVMRSAEGARRFASIRASRDPFASIEVDVRPAETTSAEVRPKRQPPRMSKSHARAEQAHPVGERDVAPVTPPERADPVDGKPSESPNPSPASDTTEQRSSPEPVAGDAVRLRALTAPRAFPDALQESLADGLNHLRADFDAALLFQADYMDGHSEYLLAISGARMSQQDNIEAAVNAAMSAYTRRDIELGMTFLDADDPMAVRISRVGTRLV